MNAIDDRYHDALGIERIVPPETRDAFLTLLARVAPEPLVPFAIVVRTGDTASFVTTLPAASWTERLTWTIACEDGSAFRGEIDLRDAPVVDVLEREGGTLDRRAVVLPELPLGYHQLAVSVGLYGAAEAALIVAPTIAYPPPEQRAWGIAVQLYTLRSRRNWGIGDFSDLAALATIAANVGATYLGLNPLHATHRSEPDAASPYAPTSRSFINWLYIDIEALPEAAHPRVRAAIDDPEFQRSLERLRAEPLVDYNGVAECKDAILRHAYDRFREDTPDDPDFRAFIERGGTALARFAIFETLVERLGRDTGRWPFPYRDPATADVAAFADAERPAVDYAMYLQWRASQQLETAAEAGRSRGVALYRDLAVGIDANGADVWVNPRAYVSAASVGAPPDLLNPAGQDWGLPPLDPSALASDGYATIAELFRSNMAGAGALRIDHVMSLARLFWIPRGAPAAAGAYVRYPFADVLGVLALESQRAQCVVIGEDLGTVPSGFREAMHAAGVLSYRILLFERDADGGFTPPDAYPALGLAALGTHDVPPFTSWLDGTDLILRERLGLLDLALVEGERANRERDRRRLIGTLIASGDLAPERIAPADILIAAHRFLGRSPARIVMLQLDDALGETAPVNVPGTWDQYPNWRRKLARDLDALDADPTFLRLCETLRAERPIQGRSS